MNIQENYSKELSGTWLNWLRENLERKCDPVELVDTLRKNGFEVGSIRDHMGTSFPIPSFRAPDYNAIANVRLTRPDSLAKRVFSQKVQLYTLDGFLNKDECDRIVELSEQFLRPSTVTTSDVRYRTSSTSDLSLLNHPEVEALDEKIACTLGIHRTYSEGIQAQRYEVGQEFRQHTDYFEPKTQEYAQFAQRAGQRTWTFMVYLNDGMAGGGTKFFELNRIFTPKKGMAVIWNNLFADGTPNPATMHAGMPVEAGHKIIITKWFRDRGTGPMFY